MQKEKEAEVASEVAHMVEEEGEAQRLKVFKVMTNLTKHSAVSQLQGIRALQSSMMVQG